MLWNSLPYLESTTTSLTFVIQADLQDIQDHCSVQQPDVAPDVALDTKRVLQDVHHN